MSSLPDSDNPYEILGISPDADQRELKQAYAKLIRTFKPEKHPEEFRRIRAAYEELQAWQPLANNPPPGPPPDLSPPDPFVPAPPPTETFEPAPEPRSKPQPEPERQRPTRPRTGRYALIEEVMSTGSGARRSALLEQLGAVPYDELRSGADVLAAEFYRLMIAGQGLAGNVSFIENELRNPDLFKDSVGNPALERVVHAMVAYLALFDPEFARQVFEELYIDADDPVIEIYYYRSEAAKHWNKLHRKNFPGDLRALLLAGPLLDSESMQRYCANLGRSMLTQPTAYYKTMQALDHKGVLSLLTTSVAPHLPWEAEETDPPEKMKLTPLLRGEDRLLETPVVNTIFGLFILMLIGVIIFSFVQFGWWGFLGLGIGMVLFFATVIPVNNHAYRKLRFRLFKLILSRGYSPLEIAKSIRRHKKELSNLTNHDADVEADAVLNAAHQLYLMQKNPSGEDEEPYTGGNGNDDSDDRNDGGSRTGGPGEAAEDAPPANESHSSPHSMNFSAPKVPPPQKPPDVYEEPPKVLQQSGSSVWAWWWILPALLLLGRLLSQC